MANGKKPRGLDERRDPRSAPGGGQKLPAAQQQEWPGSTAAMSPRPDHGESSYRGSGRLRDKVALITGGDSGIGRAVAIAFAREGADVAIAYYDEHDDAEETLSWVRRAERQGLGLAADLRRPSECHRIVEETVEAFGKLDIVVNNAAYQVELDDFDELTPEQVARTFETNIYAYMFVAQAALRHMKEGGVILNTGSVTGFEGHEGLIDYAATKGAIHVLTKSLSRVVADRGIRVNCVSPGPVWTPLIPATLKKGHVGEFGETTAWGRPAQPVEISPSYVFLASADGRYYTGEILAPTGRTTTR
jgi:NAD(P)-dependent dehydrogenase (short-subunit alcohol dehydrogenase family)